MKPKTAKKVAKTPKLINGKHPLTVIREKVPLEILYRALGHANHTTIGVYSNRAVKNKKLTIPAEWCLTIARLTGWKLADLRPDIYLPEHKGPKVEKVATLPKGKPKVTVTIRAPRKPKPAAVVTIAEPENGVPVDTGSKY